MNRTPLENSDPDPVFDHTGVWPLVVLLFCALIVGVTIAQLRECSREDSRGVQDVESHDIHNTGE